MIEPHFDIFASNSILNLPPRLSSTRSKFLIYPSFLSVFRTFRANFDVGRTIHSDFLLDSVLSNVTNKFAKTLVAGNHAQAYKINSAGLKRKGFTDEVIRSLEKTFKLFVKSKSNRSQVNESFKKLGINCQEVNYFIDFVNSSERGITR